MKKIVISTIIATTLVTNIMAEITPYIDLGYDSFTILTNDTADINKTTCASAISTEKTSDGNSTVGLNGGVILNGSSNITTTSTNDINITTGASAILTEEISDGGYTLGSNGGVSLMIIQILLQH